MSRSRLGPDDHEFVDMMSAPATDGGASPRRLSTRATSKIEITVLLNKQALRSELGVKVTQSRIGNPVTVSEIFAGSVAASSGLLVGDTVLLVNGEAPTDPFVCTDLMKAALLQRDTEDLEIVVERTERAKKKRYSGRVQLTVQAHTAQRRCKAVPSAASVPTTLVPIRCRSSHIPRTGAQAVAEHAAGHHGCSGEDRGVRQLDRTRISRGAVWPARK